MCGCITSSCDLYKLWLSCFLFLSAIEVLACLFVLLPVFAKLVVPVCGCTRLPESCEERIMLYCLGWPSLVQSFLAMHSCWLLVICCCHAHASSVFILCCCQLLCRRSKWFVLYRLKLLTCFTRDAYHAKFFASLVFKDVGSCIRNTLIQASW